MGEVLFTHADIPGAYWANITAGGPNGKQITSHSSIIRGAYWVKITAGKKNRGRFEASPKPEPNVKQRTG